MDNRKLILAFYVLVALVVWFYCRQIFDFVYLSFYQVRRLPGIGVAREALPLVLGVVSFVVLLKHTKVNVFMDEVVTELKKVTWPTQEITTRSTIVVIVFILIASAILATFDLAWGKLLSFLLKS